MEKDIFLEKKYRDTPLPPVHILSSKSWDLKDSAEQYYSVKLRFEDSIHNLYYFVKRMLKVKVI